MFEIQSVVFPSISCRCDLFDQLCLIFDQSCFIQSVVDVTFSMSCLIFDQLCVLFNQL